MRQVVWVTTALLALGAFGGGHALGQLQRNRMALERLNLSVVPPGILVPDASAGVPPGWTLGPVPRNLSGQKMVLRYEPGGLVLDHWQRFNSYAIYGHEVEVRGSCNSACTIVMFAVPTDRICFGRDGGLGFHLASYATGPQAGEPDIEVTMNMYRRYPENIRAWIDSMGGVKNMPHGSQGTWYLPATSLWRMGYRRCAD